MATAAHPAPRIEPHVWRIASVVILGVIMSVLDTTIVNVALHDLSGDLHAPLDSIQWVITGYLLSLAAVIPITGWAVRRYGARRLYLIALVVFTVGSALCGLAWSSGSLIAFRVLQGVGGGMLTPIGQMILVKAAGPRNLPKVMSAIGFPIVLAPVFGPTLGGLLLQDAGWQWIFMINVPVGILAFTLALRLLPRDHAGAAAAGPARLRRPGARRGRHRRHHLRPVGERRGRQPHVRQSARAGARRRRPDQRLRDQVATDRSARCSTSRCFATAASRPLRSSRSASAARCSAR